jgi:hypothetical protein
VPAHPGEVPARRLGEDGLAYLSYWDDGLIILDVGNGIRRGRRGEPQFVSQYRYRYEVRGGSTGTRTWPSRIPIVRGAATSSSATRSSRRASTCGTRPAPAGYIHVVDVTNIETPVEVARYEVPRAGAHNVWAEDDVLYVAYYNAGLRAVDVSGELRGDLRACRAASWRCWRPPTSRRFVPDRPFTWGPQPYRGLVFASDHNSGLWIARLVRPE